MSGEKDIIWLSLRGKEMTERDWGDPRTRAFGFALNSDASSGGDAFMILMNASAEKAMFTLPETANEARWQIVLDTAQQEPETGATSIEAGASLALSAHSLVVLSRPPGATD
jgi:glycogen operon protein